MAEEPREIKSAGCGLQRLLQQTDDEVMRALRMPRTRYVEQGGSTLKDLLVRKKLWYKLGGGCGHPSCHICLHQQGKGITCRRKGVCYRTECTLCDKKCEGGGQ